MSDFPFTTLAAGLPRTVPFVGPETQERQSGRPFRARLGANESAFGPSPRAIEAMAQAARDVWKYGDPENFDLKSALTNHHGVARDEIMVGEGIDGLLGYLCRLLVEPGVTVVTSDGAYPTFNYHVVGFGGNLVKVPYREDAEDPAALAQAAQDTGARLVYLANPDNPMGTFHSAERVAALANALPERCLLVLDEAYVEFLPELPLPMLPLLPNVIRFRTFSKAYGMAGARVGYAIGPAPLISAFDSIRNHFGMSRVSIAGALAALNDQAWLGDVVSKVASARDRIGQIAVKNGLMPLPSAANFVALDCGGDGQRAKALLQALIERGVFVRMPFVPPQDRCIRISAGTQADLDVLDEALPDALTVI